MKQITGTIARAGVLNIDGENMTGFFIECPAVMIREISMQGLYNKPIFIQADRRKTPRPEKAPAFERLNHLQPVSVSFILNLGGDSSVPIS